MKFEILKKSTKVNIYVGHDFEPDPSHFTSSYTDTTHFFIKQTSDNRIYRKIHFLIEAVKEVDSLMGCAFKNTKLALEKLKDANRQRENQIQLSKNEELYFCDPDNIKIKGLHSDDILEKTQNDKIIFNRDILSLVNYR